MERETEIVCIDCGRRKLIKLSAYKGKRPLRCIVCANKSRAGANNPAWQGGRIKCHDKGYIRIKLLPNDFYRPMARKDGYVFEHRLVVAKHLNRCLLSWEVVHHRNGIKTDNRFENLELLPAAKYHLVDRTTKSYIKILESKIKRLESEIKTLKSHPNPRGEK